LVVRFSTAVAGSVNFAACFFAPAEGEPTTIRQITQAIAKAARRPNAFIEPTLTGDVDPKSAPDRIRTCDLRFRRLAAMTAHSALG
jgi:hypothetical protein